MKLLLKGGRVIDPANRIDTVASVLVEEGKIVAVGEIPGEASEVSGTEVIDCAGKIICPGFIDLHAHLREPGYEYKEDILTGSRAAAAGGFATVCAMPNTNPVVDNGAVAGYVARRAREVGIVNVLPIGSITKGQAGEELSEIAELVQAGCVAVSDDGKPVMKSDIMRHALDYTRMFDIPVLSHCEDINLSADGQMHEGFRSTVYGLQGIPAEAEEIMVSRDAMLAQLTGGRLHICHVSTMGSLDIIRRAKAEGIRITCEATPHHLTLTDEAVGSYDADTKVNPPLRSEEHVAALREAVASGLVDCIATDHAPHHIESKDCEYGNASFGISGLETAVALIMDRLVHTGILQLDKAVALLTSGPARILGIEKGTLTPGRAADITIIDPDEVRTVDPRHFYSKGKNTPYKGIQLRGWPWMTVVGGRIVFKEGSVMEMKL